MLIKKSKLKDIEESQETSLPLRVRQNELRRERNQDTQNSGLSEEEIQKLAEERIQEKADALLKEQKIRIAEAEEQAILEIEDKVQSKISDAEAQAQSIIQRAEVKKEEAEITISEKQDELREEAAKLEELIETEKERAYSEGFAEGQELKIELQRLISNFHKTKREILETAKKEILSVAIDVAKQIIGREISIDPNILETQISRSIQKVSTGKGKIQIVVNPEDLKSAKILEPAIKSTLETGVSLVFSGDEKVDPASCIIQTTGGQLDASFTTQLEAVKAAFQEYINVEIIDLPDIACEEDLPAEMSLAAQHEIEHELMLPEEGLSSEVDRDDLIPEEELLLLKDIDSQKLTKKPRSSSKEAKPETSEDTENTATVKKSRKAKSSEDTATVKKSKKVKSNIKEGKNSLTKAKETSKKKVSSTSKAGTKKDKDEEVMPMPKKKDKLELERMIELFNSTEDEEPSLGELSSLDDEVEAMLNEDIESTLKEGFAQDSTKKKLDEPIEEAIEAKEYSFDDDDEEDYSTDDDDLLGEEDKDDVEEDTIEPDEFSDKSISLDEYEYDFEDNESRDERFPEY